MPAARKKALWVFLVATGLQAYSDGYKYLPPGFYPTAPGFGLNTSYKKVADDYYVTLNPVYGLQLTPTFEVGVQFPMEVLILDREPKTGEKVPSVRQGTYDTPEDAAKLIRYVKRGTHLYFNPSDLFNWSLFYGAMNGGYIGHKTIINRFVTSYDPTVHKSGLMFDINNSWGGVEHFQSNVASREVVGNRVYIRPFRIFGSSTAHYQGPAGHEMARADYGEYLFVEPIPEKRGGRMGQYFHGRFKDQFEENAEETPSESAPVDERSPPMDASKKSSASWPWFTRFAIGGTVVTDYDVPLALETDGSGELVVDPDTKLPRSARKAPAIIEGYAICGKIGSYDACGVEGENLTIRGVDMELRLSLSRNLDFTPYVDYNEIRNLYNPDQLPVTYNESLEITGLNTTDAQARATGLHAGIDVVWRLSDKFILSLRPEYREMASNYVPSYFDGYYAIERTVYNPGGTGSGSGDTSSIPKLGYLRSLEADGGKKKGGFLESRLEYDRNYILDLTYEDYDGPSNSKVLLGLYVQSILGTGLYTNGYYSKANFEEPEESFIYDDRSLAAAEFGYKFSFGLQLGVAYERTWEFDDESGVYLAQDEKSVVVRFSNVL